MNESAKKGFQAIRFWIKRITTVIVPYFLTRVIMVPFMSTITFKAFLLDVFCLKPQYILGVVLIIGDVRSLESVKGAMHGVDYIFHAAALKQVPSCEFFPMEAVRTNVIGTDNVLTAAIEAGVESVICLSTDKAAYPINAMGITKAIEEKVALIQEKWLNLKCLGRRLRRFI